jgi:hypothetical protein
MTEHEQKYERLAQWLGVESLKKLVPFTPEQIGNALRAGDEHLTTLSLVAWDRKHGAEPGEVARARKYIQFPDRQSVICPCCGAPTTPPADKTAGVWGLVRAAIASARLHDEKPLQRSWSLCETVCVLKHVAKYHIVGWKVVA